MKLAEMNGGRNAGQKNALRLSRHVGEGGVRFFPADDIHGRATALKTANRIFKPAIGNVHVSTAAETFIPRFLKTGRLVGEASALLIAGALKTV